MATGSFKRRMNLMPLGHLKNQPWKAVSLSCSDASGASCSHRNFGYPHGAKARPCQNLTEKVQAWILPTWRPSEPLNRNR